MTLLVLVVDDEPDVEVLFRQQFRRELRSGRFTMEFTQSATAALQRIVDAAVVSLILILSDNMSGMSGLTAIHAVRSAGISQPVIIMTAREDEQIPAQVQALGSDAVFLRKPFGLSELDAAASTVLAHGHSQAGQKDA